MKKCPLCGLVNPDTSVGCDCGYSFAGGVHMMAPPRAAARPAAYGFLVLVHSVLWCGVAVAAVVAGISLFMTTPANAIQQSAIGSFVAPPLIAYVLARAFDELALRWPPTA
jgi:hypothetical protein